MSINQPPSIAVKCITDGDLLLEVSLKLSTQFSFEIVNGSATLNTYLHEWVENYLQKKEISFSIIPTGTFFQQAIWKRLTLIPCGSTISYGRLASEIDNPKATRAAGSACNKNPYPFFIPCHRVIQAGNKLGGFALDLEIKKRLLQFESGEIPA